MDTPGHGVWEDAGLGGGVAAGDGVVLVVDVAEGVRPQGERWVGHAVEHGLPLLVVVNKMDRLVLELHLPPVDAFAKIRYVVNTVNEILGKQPGWEAERTPRLDPAAGNVVFGSTSQQWLFTLPSFAKKYLNSFSRTRRSGFSAGAAPESEEEKEAYARESRFGALSAKKFAAQLWDPWYYNSSKHALVHSEEESVLTDETLQPSFVRFILEPIYKMMATVVETDAVDLTAKLDLQPALTYDELRMETPELLRACLQRFFYGTATTIIANLEDLKSNRARIPFLTSALGDATREFFSCPSKRLGLRESDNPSPAVLQLVKYTHLPQHNAAVDDRFFYPVVRVLRGSVRLGDQLNVFSVQQVLERNNEEAEGAWSGSQSSEAALTMLTVEALLITTPSGVVPLPEAKCGVLVHLQGLTSDVLSCWPHPNGILSSLRSPEKLRQFMFENFVGSRNGNEHCASDTSKLDSLFNPLRHLRSLPVFKIGVEALRPDEHAELKHALLCASFMYPCLRIETEDTGEIVLTAPGELYLDTVLRDLRECYGKIEIKVNYPTAAFRETIEVASSRPYTHSLGAAPTERNTETLPPHSQSSPTSSAGSLPKLSLSVSPLPSALLEELRHRPIPRERLANTYHWDTLTLDHHLDLGARPRPWPQRVH